MAKTEQKSDRLDLAARAGWLYYVAGNRQEDIAQKLNVSRPTAQRLVSLAIEEKLVKIRIDHPIADCLEYSRILKEKYELDYCEIVPTDLEAPELLRGVAIVGAAEMQKTLELSKPQLIALGTGRTLRACIEQVPRMDCPHHHIVSMVGNTTLDGSATSYNTVVRLAARVSARHNPLPLTVYVRNPEDRAVLHAMEPVENTLALCAEADITFVGIGDIDAEAPVVMDNLLSRNEVRSLLRAGAVGEIIGWVYDLEGNLISGLSNDRITSAPLIRNSNKPVIGIAVGEKKVSAIRGALHGKIINGLITDERTAELLLEPNGTD